MVTNRMETIEALDPKKSYTSSKVLVLELFPSLLALFDDRSRIFCVHRKKSKVFIHQCNQCKCTCVCDLGHVTMFEFEKNDRIEPLSSDIVLVLSTCKYKCARKNQYYVRFLDRTLHLKQSTLFQQLFWRHFLQYVEKPLPV